MATIFPPSCSSMMVSASFSVSSIWSTIFQTREGAGKEQAASQWNSIGEEMEGEAVEVETETEAGRSGDDRVIIERKIWRWLGDNWEQGNWWLKLQRGRNFLLPKMQEMTRTKRGLCTYNERTMMDYDDWEQATLAQVELGHSWCRSRRRVTPLRRGQMETDLRLKLF